MTMTVYIVKRLICLAALQEPYIMVAQDDEDFHDLASFFCKLIDCITI